MDLTRRFLFHGDALAIGGRIVRPKDLLLDARCGSTLPVTGGRTSCDIKKTKFDKYVRFDSASSLADGKFDDRKKLAALTNGVGRQEDLSSTTIVRAEVKGLIVGIEPQLTIRRLRVSLTGKSPSTPEEEIAIGLGSDTVLDSVAIGDHKLIIEINKGLFQEQNTYSKLKQAASDTAFVQSHASHLAVGATIAGKLQVGLIEVRGVCYGTIVKSIRWRGKPYPGAVIDGHLVTVPEFGRIYFGEILIARDSRRVTMVRCEFGSPFGGNMGAGDVQDNGSWYP